jgi:DNA-directed RNA polymerase subunit RPC12/RpoP
MGKGIQIRCRNCSARQDFLLGVGWDYFSLDTVISALHPAKRAEIRTILQGRNVSGRESGWRIYQCVECNKLSNRFWIKIRYDGAQTYETEYACSKCGGKLHHLQDLGRVTDIPCQYCGQKTLALADEFLWD